MESGPFSQDQSVIDAMDQFVVVSLVTDTGPRKSEFADLRSKLAGTSTNPTYVLRDSFDDKVLAVFDYNDAMAADFGKKIAKAYRRFNSRQRRRGVTTGEQE